MSRILLLGNFGYIGLHCQSVLKRLNINYDCLDIGLYGSVECENLVGRDIRTDLQKLDLSKYLSIIHVAAIVGDGGAQVDSQISKDVELNSLKYIRDNYSGRLVWASSCSIYGASESAELLTESSPLNPLSLYAENKVSGEEILKNRPNTVIFRLSTIYGCAANGGRERFDLAINRFVIDSLTKNEITIFGGDQYRPFLNVKDAAEYFVFAATSSEFDGKFNLYNIGETNITIRNLANLMKEHHFPDLTIKQKPISTSDARNYRVSFSKAVKEFGFITKYNLINEIGSMKAGYSKYNKFSSFNSIYSNEQWLKYLRSINQYN